MAYVLQAAHALRGRYAVGRPPYGAVHCVLRWAGSFAACACAFGWPFVRYIPGHVRPSFGTRSESGSRRASRCGSWRGLSPHPRRTRRRISVAIRSTVSETDIALRKGAQPFPRGTSIHCVGVQTLRAGWWVRGQDRSAGLTGSPVGPRTGGAAL
jgi:hypothetical protein